MEENGKIARICKQANQGRGEKDRPKVTMALKKSLWIRLICKWASEHTHLNNSLYQNSSAGRFHVGTDKAVHLRYTRWKSGCIDSCCRCCVGLFIHAKHKSLKYLVLWDANEISWNSSLPARGWLGVGSFPRRPGSPCTLQQGLMGSFDGPTATSQVRTPHSFLHSPTPTPSIVYKTLVCHNCCWKLRKWETSDPHVVGILQHHRWHSPALSNGRPSP